LDLGEEWQSQYGSMFLREMELMVSQSNEVGRVKAKRGIPGSGRHFQAFQSYGQAGRSSTRPGTDRKAISGKCSMKLCARVLFEHKCAVSTPRDSMSPGECYRNAFAVLRQKGVSLTFFLALPTCQNVSWLYWNRQFAQSGML
jgi:hypothetical protein